MTQGWQSLSAPRVGAEAFQVSPFARLARAHAVAVAGDTLVTIALAGTLFFSIDPSDARWRVFLYLALTMAPFAVVAPLVGPALDRSVGGRRWMVVAASSLRAVVCAFMIFHVDSLLLFPEAFLLLVLSKSYHVAKSALVPSTVHSDEELVQANSKLSLISGMVGFLAAMPGGLLLRFGDSEAVLVFAVLVFAVGAVVALGLPRATVAIEPATEVETEELRSGGIRLAAQAMGLFRGIVGFLTFLLAFRLRTDDSPTWHFGVVLALSAGGALAGAALAPILRRHLREERIIIGLLAITTVAGLLGAWGGDLAGASVMAGTVGVGAAAAKQAFDSIVQRDAPDANRGRSFARFETRFQLIWVVGAALGILPMPMWVGFLIVAATALFAAVTYEAGSRGRELRIPQRRRRSPEELGFARDPDLPATIVTPRADLPTWSAEQPTTIEPSAGATGTTEAHDPHDGSAPADSGASAGAGPDRTGQDQTTVDPSPDVGDGDRDERAIPPVGSSWPSPSPASPPSRVAPGAAAGPGSAGAPAPDARSTPAPDAAPTPGATPPPAPTGDPVPWAPASTTSSSPTPPTIGDWAPSGAEPAAGHGAASTVAPTDAPGPSGGETARPGSGGRADERVDFGGVDAGGPHAGGSDPGGSGTRGSAFDRPTATGDEPAGSGDDPETEHPGESDDPDEREPFTIDLWSTPRWADGPDR